MELLQTATVSAMQEYFDRCRLAEQHRAEEEHAAVVFQGSWRGQLQRKELAKLRHTAITIQRYWRGYLGRRRFAAALAARNQQLRQEHFDHHATVIQKCWRGHFSRSRIHDFNKRREFLASVAAANAAIKADMNAALAAALSHQQHTAYTAAQQHFTAQVARLHHLASTASIPGVFSPPATAAAAASGSQHSTCMVAGQPLEHHLRTASRLQATAAVKHQQATVRQAIGNAQHGSCIFPSGVPTQMAATAAPSAGHTAATAAASRQSVGFAGPGACSAAGATPSPRAMQDSSNAEISSRWTHHHHHAPGDSRSRRTMQSPQPGLKPALKMVEQCVDDVFAARAEPNMPDGSFNPGLSLQQSADYEAVRQAADLDRRLERGLMLVMHKGQHFVPESTKVSQQADAACDQHQSSSPSCEQVCSGAYATSSKPCDGVPASSSSQSHWRHNKFPGGLFSKHLKQVY